MPLLRHSLEAFPARALDDDEPPSSIVSRLRRLWSLISDLELTRRQLTMTYALSSSSAGFLSTLVHLSTDASARALFNAAVTAVFCVLFVVLWRWERAGPIAAHLMLLLSGICLMLSPMTAPGQLPIFLGVVTLPFSAALMTGSRGALVWTVISVGVLAAAAFAVDMTPAVRGLAWNTTIITALIGFACVWVERSREQAQESAAQARRAADREASSRSEVEARLAQREALLDTIFQRAPTILVLYDFDADAIAEVNDEFSRVVGWPRGDVVGRSFADIEIWVSPADKRAVLAYVRESRFPDVIETRIRARSGDVLVVLSTVEGISVDDRPHLLINALDVSERQREQERDRNRLERVVANQNVALEASRSQLQRQHRLASIGTLAAGIAHEINNPVGAVRLIAEFELGALSETDADAAEIRSSLRRIVEEADRCGEIVRGVLQFSREEPMSKWANDLNAAVARACENLRPSLGRMHGARVEFDPCREPLPIMMSPIGIEQVLSNLLRNAAESGDGVIVHVRTTRKGGAAIVTLRDNGCGMDAGEAARVFDPFFTTRFTEGGTGLGLSIVHGLVEDHEGTVAIDSEKGRGTTVRLTFPILDAKPGLGRALTRPIAPAPPG